MELGSECSIGARYPKARILSISYNLRLMVKVIIDLRLTSFGIVVFNHNRVRFCGSSCVLRPMSDFSRRIIIGPSSAFYIA